MQTFALVMTAVFGCVIAIGVAVIPGALSAQKVLAVGTGVLVTMLVAFVLTGGLKSKL